MMAILLVAQALSLEQPAASRFAQLALKCVQREYPNKLDHVMNDASEVLGPRQLHPSFYGCFDWHSAVHGHWMLARLLHKFPDLPEAAQIRAVLDQNLSPANIAAEVKYFGQANRKSFERTYGWAWLLELQAELLGWPEAKGWAAAVQPLADTVVKAFEDFLPRQDYPIRTGVHPNTAYALGMLLDYARVTRDDKLAELAKERARAYYGRDHDAPMTWEPSGEDFLSPTLEEAALMAQVYDRQQFARWVRGFIPDLLLKAKLEPAKVSDRSDPKIVHLDGLNLSRARCLYALGEALPQRRDRLRKLADAHAEATLPHVESGSYEGEHWLATFAVRMLDAR
ncbi:MAG TPA: DUF2891 domain-containing protein [Myxococcales bacterium]|nr:DUF2891 domain-containing protein [Myxococcales bacterium]